MKKSRKNPRGLAFLLFFWSLFLSNRFCRSLLFAFRWCLFAFLRFYSFAFYCFCRFSCRCLGCRLFLSLLGNKLSYFCYNLGCVTENLDALRSFKIADRYLLVNVS